MLIEVKDVIQDVELKPFEEPCEFQAHVYEDVIENHKLIATVLGGYKVILAELIIGTSMIDRIILSHAIFKSYDSHGNKMREAEACCIGDERKFRVVKNAMIKAGIEFKNTDSCHILDLLDGLGAYYQAYNHEIRHWTIVSQRCH